MRIVATEITQLHARQLADTPLPQLQALVMYGYDLIDGFWRNADDERRRGPAPISPDYQLRTACVHYPIGHPLTRLVICSMEQRWRYLQLNVN